MQCCLICGRTLTDREVHDALEEQVLKSIRDEHPEWTKYKASTTMPAAINRCLNIDFLTPLIYVSWSRHCDAVTARSNHLLAQMFLSSTSRVHPRDV